MNNPQEKLSLVGHHALVCGASRGIGRAAAELLAARGAEVTLMARDAQLLDEVVEGIVNAGGKAVSAVADFDDLGVLEKIVDDLAAKGGIDIVINNSGGPPGGPLLDADIDAMRHALSRHLFAGHLLVQKLLPGMRARGYGRFVNILSTSVREPIPNLGVSNLTRAAVASWAKTISTEMPPGVTINNILPGFTDTDRLTSLAEGIAERSGATVDEVRKGWIEQIPEGRLADASETAEAIAFLVSPAAAYIRGHSLPVDGGRMRSI